MRLLNYLLLLLLFTTACQNKNERIDLEPDPEIIIAETSNVEDETNTTVQRSKDEKPVNILELRMQWVSYITGRVLRYNNTARLEVLQLLPEGTEVIALEDLLENRNPTEFSSSFIDMLELFITIIDENGKPGLAEDSPPGGGGGSSSNPTLELVQLFLNYVLNENCIELYFPKGLSFTPEFEITSTAHPLTLENENYGYLRYYEPILIGEEEILVEEITFNPTYLNQADNIIIARPVRPDFIPDSQAVCNYEQYQEIDFTLFPL